MSRFGEPKNVDGQGVPTKDTNLCRAPGCQRIWTIVGYCRECYGEQRALREESASDEVARSNIAKLRKLIGSVRRPLPYDPNRRQE